MPVITTIFSQADLIKYAKEKGVAPAKLSAELRNNPETNPDNWDPSKEPQYKAVVDRMVQA